MAGEAIYYGTGRRKNAVARVRIVPGTGKVTVNGRDGLDFFGRQALVDYAKTLSLAAMAAARLVRQVLCAWASLALFSRLAIIAQN